MYSNQILLYHCDKRNRAKKLTDHRPPDLYRTLFNGGHTHWGLCATEITDTNPILIRIHNRISSLSHYSIPLVMITTRCVNTCIKMVCYQYRDSQLKDETVARRPYLNNGNPHTWKDDLCIETEPTGAKCLIKVPGSWINYNIWLQMMINILAKIDHMKACCLIAPILYLKKMLTVSTHLYTVSLKCAR